MNERRSTGSEPIEADPSAPEAEVVGFAGDSPVAAPAAAERPERRAAPQSLVAGTYALFAAGVILLGAALLAAETASTAGMTALAGALVIALAAALLTELLPPRLVAALGLLGGVALGISALAVEAIGGPEVGRLLAGSLLVLGCGGILAASLPRRDRGTPA